VIDPATVYPRSLLATFERELRRAMREAEHDRERRAEAEREWEREAGLTVRRND
jgi:hypothetical protein